MSQSDRIESEVICQRFLPILEFEGDEIAITQSPLGTGKTTSVLDYIRFEKPKSVIFVMFRRSLTRNIVSKLIERGIEGFVNYQKARGYLTAPRLLIQVESLHRLKRFEFDLVVVDEITSVLGQFISPFHKNALEENRATFQKLFQNPRVVLMDGFVDNRTLNFVMKVSKNPIYILQNTFRVDQRSYKPILEHQIGHKIRGWVASGKNLVVPCGTKSFASKLVAQLRNWKITTLYFSSETKNHQLIDNINETVKHFRVLVYTPSLQAGIDISVEHFDIMVAYGSPYSCCARDFFQMIWRVRHLSTQEVWVCVQKGQGKAVKPRMLEEDDLWGNLAYLVNLEAWVSAQNFKGELNQLIHNSRNL